MVQKGFRGILVFLTLTLPLCAGTVHWQASMHVGRGHLSSTDSDPQTASFGKHTDHGGLGRISFPTLLPLQESSPRSLEIAMTQKKQQGCRVLCFF